ncbi:hypothetical protein ACQKP8_26905 [Photobacterium alginatilyticum]|uniref:hypothetical protein n=1 Tax=Photobacterium alginatilyticum TaxID=1775171 RepID=UPI0040687C20
MESSKEICGIVMPISAIDGCNESHWSDVLSILSEGIEDAGFEPNLVSNSDDIGVIQKRIVQNLYENPMVVCDVSGKNPNVMFELGLRLAFDKPTIIIKDSETSYSFDTSSIEHLEYPRDLRFTEIVEFKRKLKEKIVRTYKKFNDDPEYTTFLKHFGEFKVAKIDTKEVSGQELIIDELRNMRSSINRLESSASRQRNSRVHSDISICLKGMDDLDLNIVGDELSKLDGILKFRRKQKGDHSHIDLSLADNCSINEVKSFLSTIFPEKNIRVVAQNL